MKSVKLTSKAFEELVSTTRTIRRFSPRRVDSKVVRYVIEMAAKAPSSGNTQPWHFIVVRNKALKSRIGKMIMQSWKKSLQMRKRPTSGKMKTSIDRLVEQASKVPLIVFVCCDTVKITSRYATRMKVPEYNEYMNMNLIGSIFQAIQNLIVAARVKGLGTCPSFQFWNYRTELKRLLKVPSRMKIYCMIFMGYPHGSGLQGSFGKVERDRVTKHMHWDHYKGN